MLVSFNILIKCYMEARDSEEIGEWQIIQIIFIFFIISREASLFNL